MTLSKEITLDTSIPYDLLKQTLEDDAKVPKITKYYRNTLAMRKTTSDDTKY